jgi:hypothetical protein
MENDFILILLGGLIILIFGVSRQLVTWYLKINEIINNQEKTNLMIKKYMEAKGIQFTDDEISRLKS